MKLTIAFCISAALALSAVTAQAQDFPTKPVTIINPYSAGGPLDLLTRIVADAMGPVLGQPVIVENRPGAATAIGATAVAGANPDGYTLLIAGAPTHAITPVIQPDVTYDGLEDFKPVSMVALVPNVLVVNKASGIANMDELVAKAKEKEDALSFASVGNGSLLHLLSVFFMQETGTKMVHIPYPGAGPAVVDLLAGNVDMSFLNVPPVMSNVESGDLVPLAVASSKRAAQLPDVPTMIELGFKDFDISAWYGISAPAATPDDVVAKLDSAVAQVLKDPALADRLEQQGVEIFYKNSADFASFLKQDAVRMEGLIKSAGLRDK